MNNIAYIYWNPDIAIVDLGFYELRWYSLCFSLGFIFSYILLKGRIQKEGFSEANFEKLAVYIGISAVIGARLGHVLFYDFNYYSKHIAEIFLPFKFEPAFTFTGYEGLASHGGGIAVLIALFFYSRKYKVNLLWILDRLAIVVPLAGCMIRFGNLMNSEIIGIPTTLPWAFVFQRVDNVPRHPGQLYEAIAYFGIFIFLNVIQNKLKKEPGFIFGLFLTLMFSARFLAEFIKENQSAFEADMLINMGQVLSIPLIIAGVALMLLKRGNRFPEGFIKSSERFEVE